MSARPLLARPAFGWILAAAILLAISLALSSRLVPRAASRDVSAADSTMPAAATLARGSAGMVAAERAPVPPAGPTAADVLAGVALGAAANGTDGLPLPQTSDSAAATMLVRTGTASVQVDSLELAIGRVREIARRVGGAVADLSVSSGRDQNPSATLELRVPSARFDDAVSGLSPVGKVEAVNVEVEDVGEEYVDVAARVENARRLETRLVQLLATRTGKLGDVLQVERELARVREEIERYEGRLRYLRARASVSRLTVTVHEPLPLVAATPADHPIRDAFKQAWRNFVGVLTTIIASLGVLVPLGALALGAWMLLRGRLLVRARGAEPAHGD